MPSKPMTKWGVGPKLVVLLLPVLALAIAVQRAFPDFSSMSRAPHLGFRLTGGALIVAGLLLWASGAVVIDRAFREGRLLTTGAYGIVRHPMYCGILVLMVPGIALWLRTWPLLVVAAAGCFLFSRLIREEEAYLEGKFGQAFLDYRSRVGAVVPFLRSFK